MLKIFILYLLYFVKDVSLQQTCEAENKYDWSYHGSENGPSHWGDMFPDCNKEYGSPIDIMDNNAVVSFPELSFPGFDIPITKAKIENLGYTVKVTPEDDVQRTVSWKYADNMIEYITFHFGNPGAEHMLDGVTYAMEVQYFTYTEERDTLAIFSTLIDVEDENNAAFGSIVEVFSDIKYRGDATELKSDLDLSALLPERNEDGDYPFYFYLGSVTTPPCEPKHAWWISQNIGKIGTAQLDEFMGLYSVEEEDASPECMMGPNHRPVQEIGRRDVFKGPRSGNGCGGN